MALIFILGIAYMVMKRVKNYQEPEPDPEPQQNQVYNNMARNPALISSVVQGSFMVLLVIVPGMFVTNKGPNGFIIGYLPLLTITVLVVPTLFYAFNHNLRRFVVREVKEVLGLNSSMKIKVCGASKFKSK